MECNNIDAVEGYYCINEFTHNIRHLTINYLKMCHTCYTNKALNNECGYNGVLTQDKFDKHKYRVTYFSEISQGYCQNI